ncbi:hypothetical protein C2S51_016409 [Perilla frutescens var. frutescens]|nr:hypothetical protein C2S51_016409 [Perilla frutescens var. frutescens]
MEPTGGAASWLSFCNKDFPGGNRMLKLKKKHNHKIRLQFLCKKWFNLINTSAFIRRHAQQSETVLICKKLTLLASPASLQPKSYFQFLDLNGGDSKFIESSPSPVESVHIQASCDGLILATEGNRQGLMLMNPVTRKHAILPLCQNHSLNVESFGISFCKESKTYKVVHLFRENSGYVGCEILNVCSRKWTRTERPCSDFLMYIRDAPVSIDGSFYWMPNEARHDHFVSMSLKDETFVAKKLPVRFVCKDRLMEIEGNLGFVTHAQPGVLQVWVLMRENWMNRYTIDVNNFDVAYPIPICCSRNGKDLVLGGSLRSDMYVYSFENKVVKSSYDDEELFLSIDECYIPHTHTLVSWEDIDLEI